MKPEESLAPHELQVAANCRPTGMKPLEAKHRKICFTAFPREGNLVEKPWQANRTLSGDKAFPSDGTCGL
jgi:hypothetical protein